MPPRQRARRQRGWPRSQMVRLYVGRARRVGAIVAANARCAVVAGLLVIERRPRRLPLVATAATLGIPAHPVAGATSSGSCSRDRARHRRSRLGNLHRILDNRYATAHRPFPAWGERQLSRSPPFGVLGVPSSQSRFLCGGPSDHRVTGGPFRSMAMSDGGRTAAAAAFTSPSLGRRAVLLPVRSSTGTPFNRW
jgi:hypothetical protein